MTDEIRDTLEFMAQAVTGGLEKAFGPGIEMGLVGHYDDDEVLKRRLPLRAAMVEMREPLADCMIAVSAMHEDNLTAAITAACVSLAKALDCEGEFSAPTVHEYDNHDYALEQLDALYEEATLHFTTPKGDLLLVVGSDLVPAVMGIRAGLIEPNPRARAAGEPEEGPRQTDTSGELAPEGAVVTLGAMDGVARQETEIVAGTPISAARVEDAVLPDFAPAPAADLYAATAAANALAAAPNMERLLSGVEVELSAELGRANMRLGEISSLVRDSVFTLDQTVDDPVRIYVNGALFGMARLVVVGDEYGIEVLEVFDEKEVLHEHPLAA